MNQTKIGAFAAKKRREKNLTQAQLAERLGVSNKTISKWETGKCIPDYSMLEPLCKELSISIAEFLDGGETGNGTCTYDDAQILDLIKRTQALEHQRTSLYGMILMMMGLALLILHYNVGGSNVKDFFSGLLLGLSIAEMIVGIYVTMRGLSKQNKRKS